VVGLTDLRGDTTLFTEPYQVESRPVDSETVEDWKNNQLLQEIEGYKLCDIYNADETGLFLIYNLVNKTFTF
jgi:hypothetical protein